MPKRKGKEYAYTAKGKAAYKAAVKKDKKKKRKSSSRTARA